VQQQTQEFMSIRAAVADIEAQALKRRSHYEDEITRLNAEINNLRSHSAPPPSALGMSGMSGMSGVTLPSISMRERGERERDGPVGPPPQPVPMQQPAYTREYDRDRREERELDLPHPKRKQHDKKDPPGGGIGRGPPGPPADYHNGPPPPLSSTHKSPPARGSYLPPEQTPRPSSAVVRPREEFPGDLDPATVPAEYRKDGEDWFALYNPRVPQSLNVNLVHQFNHESVVCCVRFSKDGLWLATGCNRTAQIFDMRTGQLSCTLNDDNVSQEGDLYIRAVCFSPDGKFLATGAEDRLIRVRFHVHLSICPSSSSLRPVHSASA
jgi:glucose repression regulatory protein TUP1